MTSTSIARLRLASFVIVAIFLLGLSIGPLTHRFVPVAQAAESVAPVPREPVARVLVHLSRVNVSADLDWGAEDVSLDVTVKEHKKDCTGAGCVRTMVNGHVYDFEASNQSVTVVDRTLPQYGDTYPEPAVNSALGIPIRVGYAYELIVEGRELDMFTDDSFGTVRAWIADTDGKVKLGPALGRSRVSCAHSPFVDKDYCEDNSPGAYTVEYEIVPASLPDLHPASIKQYPLLGTPRTLVCTTVKNEGIAGAGPFELSLKVNGAEPAGGRTQAGKLDSGAEGDLCVEVVLPTAGTHELTATVDVTGNQYEYNEANNVYRQSYTPAGGTTNTGSQSAPNGDAGAPDPKPAPSSSPSSTPAPKQARSDLTVGTLKVNGQVTDGKDDCKDGKNAVAVIVKNGGEGKAGTFSVRLLSDGDEVGEKSVDGLEAGKEREVRFDDVRLKAGSHELVVTLDPTNAVAESDDENNRRTVSVRCKGSGM